MPKTQEVELDTSWFNTHHYNIRIKSKMEQSRERVAPSPNISVVAFEKEPFGSPSTLVANDIDQK